jgi:hypothetical protein
MTASASNQPQALTFALPSVELWLAESQMLILQATSLALLPHEQQAALPGTASGVGAGEK